MAEGRFRKHRFILDVSFTVPLSEAKAFEIRRQLYMPKGVEHKPACFVRGIRLRKLEELLRPPGRRKARL
jgi:hypothetical protein